MKKISLAAFIIFLAGLGLCFIYLPLGTFILGLATCMTMVDLSD